MKRKKTKVVAEIDFIRTYDYNLKIEIWLIVNSLKYGDEGMEYLSISQTAEKWGLLKRWVQVLCSEKSSETADLFMSVIMYRLKENGRAAVILPDGFLFGTDNAKVAIKTKLFSEFNRIK